MDTTMRLVRRTGYTHLPNDAIVWRSAEGAPLSARALGLLWLMLSKPDGWAFSYRRLAREVREGEEAVRTALKELRDAGFVSTVTLGGAAPTRYTMVRDSLDAPWPDGSDAGSLPQESGPGNPGNVVTTDYPRSSSLRSDDGDSTDSRTPDTQDAGVKPKRQRKDDDLNRVVTAYWEQHVAENDGLEPTHQWLALRAVARAAMKAGCSADETVAGMLRTNRMTAAAVVAAVAKIRRQRSEQPTTAVVRPEALYLFHRCLASQVGSSGSDDGRKWIAAISTVLNWGRSLEEVTVRCALRLRYHGTAGPSADDLTDRDMPVAAPIPAPPSPDAQLDVLFNRAFRLGRWA